MIELIDVEGNTRNQIAVLTKFNFYMLLADKKL